MTTRQVITPDDGSEVDPHPHDASEISGQAEFITLRVDRLLAGTISGKEVVVAGGTDGILRSDNFSAGADGWQVLGDGSAEFNDVTVRGTIIAGAGSDIGFDDVSAGENTAALVIGSGGDMQSSNFSAGSAGWQIAGDGSAEFNNVVVRGDIESDNWDGASPASLSSKDGTATAGFYLDSSEGAGQFEGDIFLGGQITIDNPAGDRSVIVSPTAAGVSHTGIAWMSDAGGGGSINNSIYANDTAPSTLVIEGAGGGSGLRLSSLGVIVQLLDVGKQMLLGRDGTASAPVVAWEDDPDTGIYRHAANQAGLAAGGTSQMITGNSTDPGILVRSGSVSRPGMAFITDLDTGVYLESDGVIAIGGAGTLSARFSSSRNFLTQAAGDTTSNAANVFITTADGRMQRSTSSLAYKPDWQWAWGVADYQLPTPITWTDEKGQTRLGFGAEHVHKAVPEAYEDEIYDLRSLVAILSEKVKRLEST